MNSALGDQLIAELIDSPEQFKEAGRAYQLLQACFDGYPLSAIGPLLRSDLTLVKHAAVFVASELGSASTVLLNDIVPLLESGDRYLKYHALEAVMACSADRRPDAFYNVLKAFGDHDEVIRRLALRLAARSNDVQLVRGHSEMLRLDPEGLESAVFGRLLLTSCPSEIEVLAALTSAMPLIRKYGALAVVRYSISSPKIAGAVCSSIDPELSAFFAETANS